MLTPTYTKPFRKQYKLMQKRGLDTGQLREVMTMLINEHPLPPARRSHPLHGEWAGAMGCHIQGDWVLIYEIDSEGRTVIFHRTGSHADLF
uniref:YafQ toxin protein n=1 Tax=uncultured bacterium contig00055 TaxID=1181539 RepID=A0A806KKB5_9BACT|nr:YafQ toxin protein [uncultured bacterium contig00055]